MDQYQYLYRLYGPDSTLLYAGISDDWTRRLRQHWQDKPWAGEIISVLLETYADRRAVRAAERKAIQSEHPLYNIQHNHRAPDPDEPVATITAADIAAIAIILIATGYVIYELSQAAITKYRAWKADRDEFREWQRTRHAQDNDPGREQPPATNPATVGIRPATPPPATIMGMVIHASLPHPPQNEPAPQKSGPE